MLRIRERRKKEQPGSRSSRRLLPSFALTTRVWLAIGTALTFAFCLGTNVQPQRFDLHLGETVPRDIRAPLSMIYMDSASRLVRSSSKSQPSPQTFTRDRQAPLEALDEFQGAIRQIQASRSAGRSLNTRVAALGREVPALPTPLIRTLLNAPVEEFEAIARCAEAVLTLEMSQRTITSNLGDLTLARNDLPVRALAVTPDPSIAQNAAALASPYLRPNIIERPAPSSARVATGHDGSSGYVEVRQGDLVARKGETVTPRMLDLLDSLGLTGPPLGPLWRLCVVALCIGSLLAVVVFLKIYHPDIYRDTRQLALLSFIVVTGVAALRFLGYALGLHFTPSQYGFFALMWVTAAAMLITTLVRADVAMLIAALLSFHTAILLGSQLQYGVAALFSATAGICSARRMRQRSEILQAMGVLAVVNLLSVSVLTVWNEGPMPSHLRLDLGIATAWALGAGLMSPVLFFTGVTVLEWIFGVTTDFTLLELCDSHQPLLRRLVLEAPGTYAHSLGVASLAEAAAEAIGAHALWVRAGALYHDVGKISRPYFFVENQQGENLHKKLSPTMSAKIITAHICDGVELAQEHRLPPFIIDCIRQHHGTGLVTYFYHQAIITSDAPNSISENAFRYPGPKPQTRETGILMLADVVESTVRAMGRPNPGRIEATVARIIQGRVADGQLSECDLTFRDIDRIQSAFARVLGAIHHGRIEYPAMENPEERLVAGGGAGR